jgi:hypothetical protein
MIGVDGQYLLRFTIGDQDDFVEEEDLILFKIIEESSNTLPTFEASFAIHDDELLPYLNEGNELKVSIGADKNDLADVTLVITKSKFTRSGESARVITISGLYSALEYISSPKVSISDKKSGIEVINDIVSPYFTFDSNITKSEDSQNWVQTGINDKLFVDELSLHSYVSDSFIAVAISADGTFIVRDMKKMLNEDYKWRFGSDVEDPDRDIAISGDLPYESEVGFMNMWAGYQREMKLVDLEKGTESMATEEISPFLALSSKLMRNASVGKKTFEHNIICENVDPNYWNAYLRNLGHLAVFSGIQATVSFQGVFKDIKALDLVMLRDDAPDSSQNQSSDTLSGLWVVSKVVRTVQSKQFWTILEICRESLNMPEGNLA